MHIENKVKNTKTTKKSKKTVGQIGMAPAAAVAPVEVNPMAPPPKRVVPEVASPAAKKVEAAPAEAKIREVAAMLLHHRRRRGLCGALTSCAYNIVVEPGLKVTAGTQISLDL